MGSTQLTNASSGTVNARRFQSQWAAVVTAVVFEFSVMRCQPLRRALAHTSHKLELVSCYGISVQWSFALV